MSSRAALTRTARGDVLSIAPMMEYTDRPFRTFMRLLTKRTKLYTEMVVSSTVVHCGERLPLYAEFDPVQHPVACQLGGNNPDELARAAELISSFGYDEINLNVGCPSPRVAVSANFFATLGSWL